jgi:tetratricopeptide (TPR) repeat protein
MAGMAEGGAMPNRAPPLTGTPREQADRLFNRVMQAQAQADTQQVAFFLPMAVLAYQQAGDLDADGLYHLSVLETAAGQAASGLASAEKILGTHPDHLLGLAAAAQAADALGKPADARRYYERLLAHFEAERGKPFPEYLDHAPVLPGYRQEAQAYLKR